MVTAGHSALSEETLQCTKRGYSNEFVTYFQEKFSIPGNHSVTGGGRVSVVFSEPLYGGSPKEWVTGLWELRDRFQGVSFLQLNSERC